MQKWRITDPRLVSMATERCTTEVTDSAASAFEKCVLTPARIFLYFGSFVN